MKRSFPVDVQISAQTTRKYTVVREQFCVSVPSALTDYGCQGVALPAVEADLAGNGATLSKPSSYIGRISPRDIYGVGVYVMLSRAGCSAATATDGFSWCAPWGSISG